MGKKAIITTVALIAAAGAGTAGVLLTSKKAKMKRFARRTGRTMYALGTMLRTLSCQEYAE